MGHQESGEYTPIASLPVIPAFFWAGIHTPI